MRKFDIGDTVKYFRPTDIDGVGGKYVCFVTFWRLINNRTVINLVAVPKNGFKMSTTFAGIKGYKIPLETLQGKSRFIFNNADAKFVVHTRIVLTEKFNKRTHY